MSIFLLNYFLIEKVTFYEDHGKKEVVNLFANISNSTKESI